MAIKPPPRVMYVTRRLRRSNVYGIFPDVANVPFAVQVEETGERRRIREKNRGVWFSKRRYSDLEMTLIFLDAGGNELDRANYDITGNLLDTPPTTCTAENIVLDLNLVGGKHIVSWNLTLENDIRDYQLQKSADGATYTSVGAPVAADGSGDYEREDTTYTGATLYRVVASCIGGTSITSDAFLLEV